MKQSILFVSFFFVVAGCIAQTSNISMYSNGVCNCLDSLSKTGGVHQNFPTCFSLTLERNSSAFMQELLQTYGDTSEKSLNKLNDDLLSRMSIDLIQSCTSYFEYTDSLQQRQYKSLNKDSLVALLKHLDSYNETQRDKEYYQYASKLYFQSGDYDNALKNVEQVLLKDSFNTTAIFIKASIEEKKGNYSEAIALYNKVAALANNNAILIYSAMAKRRKNGL